MFNQSSLIKFHLNVSSEQVDRYGKAYKRTFVLVPRQ
jgi:hypothetical protein